MDKLAEFVVNSTFSDIPDQTVGFVNELALKTIGGILLGSTTEAGRKFLRYMRNRERPPEVGVYGCGFKTSLDDAVAINGQFAHASELEDDQYPGCTSDITIVPIVFPLAEWLRLTGREVVESSFVGYEVQNRIACYTYPRTEEMGIEAIASCGIFGAAACASKALGLSVEETKAALGLAFTQSAGYIINHGTDAHYLDTAWAGRNGVTAALMAKERMTRSDDMEKWLADLMGKENIEIRNIAEGLGKPPYFVHNIWIKKYPCCFITHRQIDSLLTLMKKHKFSGQEIQKIEAHCGPIDASCDRPEPRSAEDSKFSFQHILAALILEGDITMDTFTSRKLKDPKYKEARAKVQVVVHEDWPRLEQSGIGQVNVTLNDGRKLTEGMEQCFGGPKLPLTREQIVGLYNKYAQSVLSKEQVEATKEMILGVHQMQDLSELFEILTNAAKLRPLLSYALRGGHAE